MIFLAVYQIVARNLFHSGLVWSDEGLRLLVLWTGLMGAVVATRESKQIRIDLLTRMLSPGSRTTYLINRILNLLSASICGLIAWHSWRFVLTEKEFATQLMGSIPAWPLQIILPLSFALMGLRYLIHFLSPSPHPETE